MKILCNYNHCAPSYIFTGLGRTFAAAGHEFMFWVMDSKPAFDIFSEYEPDIYIGRTFEIDRALYKCIASRPHMKVILYASAWGDLIDKINPQDYPIVRINDNEKRLIAQLKHDTGKPDFVFLHSHENWLQATLGGWHSIGVKPVSLLNAADTFDYLNGEYTKEFDSDISFVGGYWPYKARNLDRFLLPLCFERKLKVKIFGNQPWPVSQYLGIIDNNCVKDVFASAKVCVNISEPHSTDFGFDVIERPYKILASGGFCVSDYVESMDKDIFGDSIVYAHSPLELKQLINHYVENPEDRLRYMQRGQEIVLKEHTYFDRAYKVFIELGLHEQAHRVLEKKKEYVFNTVI